MSLFRLVARIAGRPVVLRVLATWGAVALPAAVIFGPQGLTARDLALAMHQALILRALVWLGWIALSMHATTSAFDAAGMSAVRVARPRRVALIASLLAMASIVHAPWFVLWLRGDGLLAAIGGVSLAVAIAASAFALLRRPSRSAALVLVAASALSLAHLPGAAPVAVGLAVAAVDRAWRGALEQRSSARPWTRADASPVRALATVHLLRLVRAERIRLVLAAMLGGLGTAGLLTLRWDPTPRPIGRAVAIMTVPLAVGASLLVAPLVDGERQLAPRLRALRVRPWVVVAAFLGGAATPTSAFAATAGVCAGFATGVSPISLGLALGTWAVVLAGVVGTWGRSHGRMRTPTQSRFVAGVAVIATVAVALAMGFA